MEYDIRESSLSGDEKVVYEVKGRDSYSIWLSSETVKID